MSIIKKITAVLTAAAAGVILAACSDKESGQTGEMLIETSSADFSLSGSSYSSYEEKATAKAETTAETTIASSEFEEDTEIETATNSEEPLQTDNFAKLKLSDLEYGMTREQIIGLIDADYDEEMSSAMYGYLTYSDVPTDLDADGNFRSFYFDFGSSGMDEIVLVSGALSNDDGYDLWDKLVSKFSEIYGFSEDDWDNNDVSSYCENKDGCAVYIRIWKPEGYMSISVTLTSWQHRSLINVENMPVIP